MRAERAQRLAARAARRRCRARAAGRQRGARLRRPREDVTAKDVDLAVAEGYDSIELSKRYTTVTMGPSQGRFSQLAVGPR